jgi:hypothetical protein
MTIARVFAFVLGLQLLNRALGVGYVDMADCSEELGMDQALIRFENPQASAVSLYAKNSLCYRCSRTLVANENDQCALLFTPHLWRIYIVDNNSSSVISKRDYTFGEHGKYTIALSAEGQVTISEDKQPIDSMKPLNTLLIVLFVVTFIAFLPSIGLVLFLCHSS